MSSRDHTLAPSTDRALATEETMAVREPATDGGAHPGRAQTLGPGQAIGRYVLLEKLGAGGMGVVFSAYDPELDRRVAIKLLRPQAGGEGAQGRLVREARAMAKLSHPNVVAVHDAGELDGAVFVAMEFVDGQTLGQWLEQASRTRDEILHAFCEAGRGLAAAHAQGLVHRDFKPDNVMVGADGRVRVMDFGLVRQVDEALEPMVDAGATDAQQALVHLTRTGALLGTPAYMAPEQYRGEASDARTDQFAFCVALHQALYGQRPFAGETVFEIMDAVTHDRRRPLPSDRDVPAWLRSVVDRGLAIEPSQRWPAMDALLEALARDPGRKRRVWMAGTGAVVLAGAALWGVAQGGDAPAAAPACTDVARAMTQQWNDDTRTRIAAAFAKSGADDAAASWARVSPRIDAYAQGWTRMRTDACLAAADGDRSQLLELRITCLEQRKDVLMRMLDTFAHADAELAAKAHDVVADLPRLQSCEDAAYLTAEVKPPEDPALAEQATALRTRIDDTLPAQWRGDYEQVLASLREIADEARAIDHRPLTAQLSYRTGVTLDYLGDYEAARGDLESCFFDAQIAGSRLLAARCANKLIHVVGDHFGEHAPALMWARHAEAAIQGGELDEQTEGSLLNNRGNVLLAGDRLDEALAAYEGALERWQRALGADHVDLAIVLANIARVHTERGEHEAAIEAHTRALQLRIRHAGEDHPHIAEQRLFLARTYLGAGRTQEAIAQLRLAHPVLERRLGPEHPQTIDVLAELGHALLGTDAQPEGIALLQRALATERPTQGSQHVSAAQIRQWLAEAGSEPEAD